MLDLEYIAGTLTINAIARSLLPWKVAVLSFLSVQLPSDQLRVADSWHEHTKSLPQLSHVPLCMVDPTSVKGF